MSFDPKNKNNILWYFFFPSYSCLSNSPFISLLKNIPNLSYSRILVKYLLLLWCYGCFHEGQIIRICLQCRRPGFNPWVRKIPWRRKWLPAPLFLPEEFHGQRSLVGCNPWGHGVRHDWAANTFHGAVL